MWNNISYVWIKGKRGNKWCERGRTNNTLPYKYMYKLNQFYPSTSIYFTQRIRTLFMNKKNTDPFLKYSWELPQVLYKILKKYTSGAGEHSLHICLQIGLFLVPHNDSTVYYMQVPSSWSQAPHWVWATWLRDMVFSYRSREEHHWINSTHLIWNNFFLRQFFGINHYFTNPTLTSHAMINLMLLWRVGVDSIDRNGGKLVKIGWNPWGLR